jgi:hypothetical protein
MKEKRRAAQALFEGSNKIPQRVAMNIEEN